jgi:hypothetical protein
MRRCYAVLNKNSQGTVQECHPCHRSPLRLPWDPCPRALWPAPPALRLYVAPVWTTAHERSVRIVSVFLVARVVSTLFHTLQDQKMSLAKIEDLDCMKPCGANRRR